MANVAEGNAKKHLKDRLNFFNIAEGSLVELDCFCELVFELNYISKEDYEKLLELINKCSYLLYKFTEAQKQKSNLKYSKNPKHLKTP